MTGCIRIVLFLVIAATPAVSFAAKRYDVVIYGGTSGGVAAAVQAARMGRTVVLVEPGGHIGGLTSGGLGATDIGNKAAIGGISRDFYRAVKRHYDRPEAWTVQRREDFKTRRRQPGGDTMWTFEPHVAETIFRNLLKEARVEVLLQQRLDLRNGVRKRGATIEILRMESGLEISGRMFIDATYEGDLMAAAGVSHHIGRESNSAYDETLNGVQTQNAIHHQFTKPVDPFVKKGDPTSGLLPGIHPGEPGIEGAGDRRVQAYCFRMCLTDAPENRLPFPKPNDYDPLRYELALRSIEAGTWKGFGNNTPMPNRKTDTNNNGPFSTDNIGRNYDYPAGDYATRDRIFQEHVDYQQGFMWFLSNDPRVPAAVQTDARRWGLAKDEFRKTGGWPHQLYIREARRMVSALVMTQHHCQGRKVVDDPVGLAAYTMDSHNTQRYAKNGRVLNEGDVQVGGFAPFPISYRCLVPKPGQADNLFVPVCLSASHIAYGSIRMEPVFMVLGQSAATAASLAIEYKVPVQEVDYDLLKKRLLADKQVLLWTGPRPFVGADPNKLPGVVVDDGQAKLIGEWTRSRSAPGFVGAGYRHDNNENRGEKSARFAPKLPATGRYEVRIAYAAHANRATQVAVEILSAEGRDTVRLNQRKKPAIDGLFQSVGVFHFKTGGDCAVTISNKDADGYVIIDAVQFLPVK